MKEHPVLPVSPSVGITDLPALEGIQARNKDAALVDTRLHQLQPKLRIDAVDGRLASWRAHGHELVAKPPEVSLWKPVIDNHRREADGLWRPHLLDAMRMATRSVRTGHHADGSVSLITQQRLAPPSLGIGVRLSADLNLRPDGSLRVQVDGRPRRSRGRRKRWR